MPALDRQTSAEIARLASAASFEVTPKGAEKIARFDALLAQGTRVYVTFLPGSSLADTITLAERLADEGLRPVPHFAARSLESKQVLEDALRVLARDVGVEEALLIGGAIDDPVGDFSESMQVLRLGLFEKYGFRRVALAGHPEGSPDISPQENERAVREKNDYAAQSPIQFQLVTQFCFTLQPILDWLKVLRGLDNTLPVRIGLPGLATIKTLLKHAQQCGIGNSMRVLMRQATNLALLLRSRAPDDLLSALADARVRSARLREEIDGVHFYPLGGFAKTALWARAVAEQKFVLEGQGFRLHADEA